MKTKKIMLLILIVSASLNIKAQSITCNSFTVTNVQYVSANMIDVTIFFAGQSTDFINYPYVSSIVDNSNSTTIATGTINFFGQFGNTSQTYTTSTTLSSLPSNCSFTIYFTYDTSVCALQYTCPPSGINDGGFLNELTLYPNPSNGIFNVTSCEEITSLEIYSVLGEKIYAEFVSASSTTINLSSQSKGIYFVKIITENNSYTQKIIIQ